MSHGADNLRSVDSEFLLCGLKTEVREMNEYENVHYVQSL